MAPKKALILKIACGFAIILLASCDTVHVHRRPNPGRGPGIGHGPPAHAKAHGYHRKQACGYDLLYDADWGVYVVVGVADCYYHEGHFYRPCSDGWQISLRVDSGWNLTPHASLPPGLRKKAQVKTHAKAHAKAAPRLSPQAQVQIGAHPTGNGNGKGKGHAKGKR